MADMMSGIGAAYGGFLNILWIALQVLAWTLPFVALIWFFFWMMKKSKEKKLIIVNQITRKIEVLSGVERIGKGTHNWMMVRKLKKKMPILQQSDLFTQGKRDVALLMKDNNGMLHSLRVPNYNEIKKWYKTIYNIDIEELKKKPDKELKPTERNILHMADMIYLQPNPTEDLNWIADQVVESDKLFPTEQFKRQVITWGITLGACLLVFLGTLFFATKM